MAALFSLSTCIFSFYISLDVFAQGSARCASTRASPDSHNIADAAANHRSFSFRSFSCLAGFFAGHHSQRTPRYHRRAGSEQKQKIIDHVRIEYNKECALKWQVTIRGENICFPKVSGKSFHNFRRYDSRRLLRRMRIWPASNFLVKVEQSSTPATSTHTHTHTSS
jgi:hypothetical protein